VANRPMLKVVIDTNVFISAFYLPDSRPAEVVFLARRKRILNCISPQILKEIERILQKKLLWDNAKTESAVRQIRNFSEEVHSQERLAIIVDDPDNRILECAVAGQADFIISGDKHLLNLKNFQGINVVTPADFLVAIEVGRHPAGG
jgi:putative PIN family toxin of toxin-antitoxin system